MTADDLRHRVLELAAAGAVVACGLVWRLAPLGLPPILFKYGGSVLWGAMVMLVVGALWPGRDPQSRTRMVIAAAVAAAAVEMVRLFHMPGLDAFRMTLAGQLLLGQVFSLWDILAYWAGIALAIPLHAYIRGEAATANTQ